VIAIAQVIDLPTDARVLADEATADGVANMSRLIADWASGSERFSKPGEALFSASSNGVLVGLGGATVEAHVENAMRMRRLYVRRGNRHSGVGTALARRMIERGFESGDLLTCNAGPPGAAEFWERLGFVRVAHSTHTHEMRRGPIKRP
jgi:GNAT superfamily N-acetyltransferase